jgi:Uma2 family endonuclease
MSTSAAAQRMTLEEWAQRDEDDTGELVDGVLVEEEVPSTIHELVIAWLVTTLTVWGRPRKALVLGSGLRMAVSRKRGRIPDMAVYLAGGRRPQPRGLIDVPPSIMVEIVTPTPRDERRDRIEKLSEYAAFGVRWYWLVDPEMRTLEVLERQADGRYAHAAAATEGVMETVPGCEGLSIDLDGLWAEVDALLREAPADP